MARAESYLLSLTDASKTPGLQYVVVTPDAVLLDVAHGWADIRQGKALDRATTMMAYSMSKTITAVAVLQLVEAGRVGLDDPAERYVPAWPYGPEVTVRHLITHTSGIPNPIPLRWVHPVARHDDFDEVAALAAVLHAHPRLSSAPGTRYRYSNIGYWLLGRVVEEASGEGFCEYVNAHVLSPLDVAPDELGYVVADPAQHATGYLEAWSFMNLLKGFLIDRELVGRYAGRWLEIRGHYLNGPAFGGLVGTAGGFGRFLQDRLRDRSVLLTRAMRDLLQTPQQTRSGTPVAMTLGWHMRHLGRSRLLYKEGGGGGFHCMMRIYPDQGLGTVLMTNGTGFDVRGAQDAVDATFL